MDPAIATPPDGDGVVTRILEPVESALAHVPPLVWVGAILLTGAATVITLPVARRRARNAGARAAGHEPTVRGDGALFAAAMAPAALFLLAVLAGSFRGLAAFGRDTLRWTDGWEYLVPLTLDGVALSFGFLAFRAVRKQQSPDRANRLVWAAAFASAVINFAHEAGLPTGSWLGGAYLGLMSVFGMLIFHEFLAQFEEGAEAIHRKTPKFGLRWITWPTNTGAAWLAWHNHPAAEGTPATIAAAVEHLEKVRATKLARLGTASTVSPWWTPLLPWLRIRQLDARAGADRAAREQMEQTHAAELATLRQAVTDVEIRVRRETAEQLTVALAERDAERAAAELAVREVDRVRSEAAERTEQLRAEHAEHVETLRAQIADSAGRSARSVVTPIRRNRPAARTPEPRPSDEESLAEMFAEHPESGFAWTDREANRITGAGFSSRAPRLVARAMEHLKTCTSERHDRCFGTARGVGRSDDAEERSA